MKKTALKAFRLSWLKIRNKPENFRAVVDKADIKWLMPGAGIVRHRSRLASTINNAKRVFELRCEFGLLASFVWRLLTHNQRAFLKRQ